MGATRPFRRAEMWCQNGSREIPQIAGRPRAMTAVRSGLDDDGDRAVVDQLDVHPRAEDAGLDGDPERAQRGAEVLVQWLGELGRRCAAEARPIPLLGIGEQGELADDEGLAAGVDERAVELAVRVPE